MAETETGRQLRPQHDQGEVRTVQSLFEYGSRHGQTSNLLGNRDCRHDLGGEPNPLGTGHRKALLGHDSPAIFDHGNAK